MAIALWRISHNLIRCASHNALPRVTACVAIIFKSPACRWHLSIRRLSACWHISLICPCCLHRAVHSQSAEPAISATPRHPIPCIRSLVRDMHTLGRVALSRLPLALGRHQRWHACHQGTCSTIRHGCRHFCTPAVTGRPPKVCTGVQCGGGRDCPPKLIAQCCTQPQAAASGRLQPCDFTLLAACQQELAAAWVPAKVDQVGTAASSAANMREATCPLHGILRISPA